MAHLEQFLAVHSISHQRFEHPPVFTCEEARELAPNLPGRETKNLFLRNKKGDRHVLLSVGYEKNVDISAVGKILGLGSLSFGSPERLSKHLGIEPGSVTLLSVINDSEKLVQVVVDSALWSAPTILCHPLVNTATLAIPREDLERFLELTGHPPLVIDVPERDIKC